MKLKLITEKHNKYCIVIAIVLFLLSTFFIQAQSLNSTQLKNNKTTDSVAILIDVAKATQHIDSIIYYSNNAIKHFTPSTKPLLRATAYYRLGYGYFKKLNYQSANSALDNCIAIAKDNNLKTLLVNAYQLKGTIASNKDQFDQAIVEYEKALTFADSLADKISLNTNLSVIYINTSQLDLALIYINELIKYNNENPGLIDNYMLTYNYLNLSIAAPTFTQRLAASNKAITIANLTKDKELIFTSLYNKAETLKEDSAYNQALKMYKEVIVHAKKNNSTQMLSDLYLSLSELSFKTKQFNQSLAYLDSINKKDTGIYQEPRKILKIDTLFLNNYLQLKNYKEASVYAQKYITALKTEKESIKDAGYIEYGKKYETEKKIQENKLLKQEAIIQNLKITEEENKVIIYSVSLLIVLILLFFFYYRFRNRKKVAQLLTQKNKLIQSKNKNLEKLTQQNKSSSQLFLTT